VDEDSFEWDVDKAELNLKKHKIDFADARRVFDDPGALDDIDDTADYGEERFRAIGMVNGRLITVFYASRGARIRIISARKPTKIERNQYAEQNPPR
jgi:uncharacterized DUF497 family protein